MRTLFPLLFSVMMLLVPALILNFSIARSWSNPWFFMGYFLPWEEEPQEITKMRRRFSQSNGLLAFGLFLFAILANDLSTEKEYLYGVLPVLYFFLTFIQVIAGNRRLKRLYGANDEDTLTVTVDTKDLLHREPHPFSLRLYVFPLLLCLGLLLFLALSYDRLPSRVITQYSFSGPEAFSMKSPALVLVFGLFPLVMVLVFLFAHWTILCAFRRPGGRPDCMSAIHGILFFYANVLCVCFILLSLTCFGVISLSHKILLILILVATFIFVVSLLLAARQTRGKADIPPTSSTNAHWYLAGTIYANPKDPAIFVPKRLGFGTTINVGNWKGAAIFLLMVLIVGVLPVLPYLLSH